MEGRAEDIEFYRKYNIHTLLGPVQPIVPFYTKVKEFTGPMTYYKPKKTGRVQKQKELYSNEHK